MADWVSAVCAVITIVAAGVTWRRSNISKEAKAAAKAAEQRANEQFELARAQAQAAVQQADSAKASNEIAQEHLAEFKRIADSLRGPTLEIKRTNVIGLYALYNRTDRQIVIESVENSDKFYVMKGVDKGTKIEPHANVELRVLKSGDSPGEPNLVLKLEGQAEPVHVPIPMS